MFSRTSLLISILFTLSIYGLFQIKYKVLELRRDTKELSAELEKEKREVDALKVEWTYLTNPQRIASLASKYLNLSNTNAERISQVSVKQAYKVSDQKKKTKILHVAYKQSHNKWRYRKDVHSVVKSTNTKKTDNIVRDAIHE